MDAATLDFLDKHPEIDRTLVEVVRYAQEVHERDGHGTTGIVFVLSGKSKPLRYREVREVTFQN